MMAGTTEREYSPYYGEPFFRVIQFGPHDWGITVLHGVMRVDEGWTTSERRAIRKGKKLLAKYRNRRSGYPKESKDYR